MLRYILLVAVLAISQISFAQVRATTESGNKVLLFDNGTWKYEEKTVATANEELAVAVVAAPALITTVEVDATREITTPFTEFFYMPSKRLERYFGEVKGRIRCKLACENIKGVVKVNYMWEMAVGDGNRYFGSFKAGSKLTFYLQNGEKVELAVGEDSKRKSHESYNFTAISGTTQPLSEAQMSALLASPVRKLEVEWKKKPEVYDMDYSSYFIENLPEVF